MYHTVSQINQTLHMDATQLMLKPILGEPYSIQKQRFKAVLAVVIPYMDYFYSGATLRRFARTPSQVRNIKQWGAVDWEVLTYWIEEYLPPELTPKAWKSPVLD